jgi:jmjN domain
MIPQPKGPGNASHGPHGCSNVPATENEWEDPLKFIPSIAKEGKEYAIAKVRDRPFAPQGLPAQFSVEDIDALFL